MEKSGTNPYEGSGTYNSKIKKKHVVQRQSEIQVPEPPCPILLWLCYVEGTRKFWLLCKKNAVKTAQNIELSFTPTPRLKIK